MSQSAPSIYNGHQSVGGSVRKGNEKRFNGLALKTAIYPLSLNRVALMIYIYFFQEMKPNVYVFDKTYAFLNGIYFTKYYIMLITDL